MAEDLLCLGPHVSRVWSLWGIFLKQVLLTKAHLDGGFTNAHMLGVSFDVNLACQPKWCTAPSQKEGRMLPMPNVCIDREHVSSTSLSGKS